MSQISLSLDTSCYSPDVSETWKLTKFFIQLFYVVPTVLIYIKFLFIVVKGSSIYSDTFFTLYIVDGVSSIIYIFLDFAIIRMMNYVTPYCQLIYTNFKEPSYWLTPYYYFYLFFQFMKTLSTVSLCANRFTSVVWPVAHNHIWKTHMRQIIITYILISAFSSSPILLGKSSAVVYQNIGTITYVHIFQYFRTSTFRIIIMLPSVIFIIISNIIIISKLSKISTNMRKVETSMITSTMVISIGFILILILSFVIVFITPEVTILHPGLVEGFIIFNQFAMDFYMISGPIVLLILDENVRKSIFYCHRETGKFSVTHVHTVTDH